MLLFFFHAGTENEDRTDLRSVLLPSGDLKGTYFPSLYVHAYFIVAKWSVILFFRFFFFFLVSSINLLQTMSHFLKWRVLVKLFHHAFYFLFVCLYNLVSHPTVKNDQSVFVSQFSLKWLTNSSSRDSDAGSRLSSQDDSHCYGQQSFIGLSLRIASLPFHLFFGGGGGNCTATSRLRWTMFVELSVRRSFVPEVKPVTVLLFLLFDTRRCMWCYLCRSVQTDNRDVSHHAPRASYRTHHYHSTLQQNHEVRHTQYSFVY